MSDLISPDLASQLKGAPDNVKLRAAEILDQIKEAKKKEEADRQQMIN